MACFFACNVYIFLFSSRSLTLLSDEFVQKKGANKIICTSKYILEDTNMENERKIKILIAEDAEETRDFLKALLETSLIEVTCVENGLEALNFLKIEKFD